MRHGCRRRSLVLLHQLSLCQSGCARLSCAAVTTERGEGQFGPQTRCQDYLLRNPLDLREDLALAKHGRLLPSRRNVRPPVGRSFLIASSLAINSGYWTSVARRLPELSETRSWLNSLAGIGSHRGCLQRDSISTRWISPTVSLERNHPGGGSGLATAILAINEPLSVSGSTSVAVASCRRGLAHKIKLRKVLVLRVGTADAICVSPLFYCRPNGSACDCRGSLRRDHRS